MCQQNHASSGDYRDGSFPLVQALNQVLHARQEIDGLQARHSHLASYLHFMGRSGLQAGYLQPVRCLHFLRHEIGGLQLRHLQSAFCLPSKTEVTTETG